MIAPEGDAPIALPSVRSLHAPGGLALLYRAWEVDAPRGVVQIVHGLGEHGGRYARFAEALTNRGISCYAADLRGHGVSGGRRGHVDRFQEYLDDVERVAAELPSGVPTFLFGHSLGGLIALRAVQRERAGAIAGLILSAPSLELAGPARPWRERVAALLSRVAPAFAQPNGIDPADLSHDPDAVAAYRSDPLVHDRITPRLFDEMRRAMREAAMEADRVSVPVLLVAPGEDRIVATPAALAVCERFAGEVTVRSWPGMYHEALNELEASRVVQDVVAWIEARLA